MENQLLISLKVWIMWQEMRYQFLPLLKSKSNWLSELEYMLESLILQVGQLRSSQKWLIHT